jgi:Glycosyltransferase family 9 (heptosyltransferase)
MNSKLLIFVDAALSVFVIVFAGVFRLRTKLLNALHVKSGSDKVLIIKFLGAGNFIAMADALKFEGCTIVSVRGNESALKEFVPSAELILINEKSLVQLVLTVAAALTKLLLGRYSKVINLEAESSFAKFIATVPYCDELTGLSNKYKSISDWFFYDYHLVSPSNLNRDRILKILLRHEQPQVNEVNALTLKALNDVNVGNGFIVRNDTAFVSPTCSLTDGNRRLSIEMWSWVLKQLSQEFKSVVIAFPSTHDTQYADFQVLLAQQVYSNVETVVESYKQFAARIQACDLLVTIDSQALHIGQQLGKSIVCFYGPTSPHGVKLSRNTCVVSKELECSPCTHKYFSEPCRGAVHCMKFDREQVVSIFRHIHASRP